MSFDPSTAAPEDGFDPTSAVPEDAPDTRTVLQTAVKANPEQAAKASKLAKKYDAPEDVLYRNLQNVELIDAVNRYDERLKTSPKLAAAMQRKPSLAQQAHDDIEPLAQIEQFLSDTGGSVKAGIYNANKGAAGVFRAGFEAVAPALDFLEPVTAVGGNPLRRLAEGFAMIGEQSGADAKAVTPKTEGNLSSGFQSGVQSLTQNLLTLPVAFLPGGQPAALGMMASTTGGMAYQDARDKGLPMERALPYAASQAAIEYATEKLPLGKLVGDLKEGTPFFKTLMHNIAGELPGEQVATLLQDLNDWAVLNPEKPFADYLAERPDAAAQTLVATIVGSGGAVTLAKAAESVVGKFGKEAERAGQAQASADQLQAQMQAAAQAKLRERNPDEFRELMSHMSDRSVYVDGDVLNQLAPEVRALLPQAVQDQIEIAAGTGDAVEIPVADVLTVAPGTPLEQMFVEHARTDPFAMSQAESKAAGEKAGEYLRTQSEEAITAAADQEAFRASSEAVRQNILGQLNEAGRYRPAVNEGMAQWAGAFYTTMASRLGLTPEQMHRQFPLRILSEPRSAGQVMDQGGITVTDRVDEVTGLPLNSDGTVTVYHHTSKTNADAITKSGKLKAAAEPDVYVTTRKETDTGYGDTAVAIRVKPEQLQIDDEFPDGRVDYRINAGKPGGAVSVQVGEPTQQSDNLNQTATQGPRATFNPKTLELVLNPNADLSSFFHETGHFFLEVMSDIASQPNVPAQIADDMNKLLSWFGVPDLATWNTMTLDQQRPYHERFAESIEQYLMESKAPSLELQPVMRRFRAWLLSVYKSLKAFVDSKPNAEQMPLNDDIRRVMDRMLATDEQIAQANEIAGLVPDETADGEAAERLQKRSIADLKWAVKARDKALKALRAQAKTIEKGIREQVTQEVDATPEMQAKTALDKLRKAKELNDATRATVADAFGYTNTDEMLQAIDAYGKRSEVIDALTERRMLEEHGDLIDERAIQEAANEAVHNEARARSLATELRTQSEMLNPRQDTGRVNSKGSKITVNALVEAAKQYGQNVADRTVLKDLKNKAWQHTAAERRASTRWKEATAKGDTQAAVKAKQDQMLNNAAAKAVIDAKNEAAKIFEFFKRVTKGNDEKVVEGGRDADIVNAARAVLKAYGVETAASKKADAYLELVKRNDPDTYGIIFPMVDGALREAQPLESLTVEQLRALNEDIGAIWYKAKQSRQMEIDGDLMDRQDIEDELKAQIQEVGVPDHMPGDTSAITPAEQRALKLKHYLATARRVESWAQGLDGSKKLGPFRKFIWQPVKEAADALRVDKAKYLKRYRDLLKGVESTLVKETIAAPELGYTFGKDTDGVAMVEVLHAILHTGNESNKRKLLLGRGWAIENQDGTLDTGKWDAFVARMIAEGKITKAHYDFAQGVWDLLEDTKPLAQKAHRYVFGRYFAEVTADAFGTPFGQYQGGYVPAQADARIVSDAATRALAEAENNSMQFAFPTTNKGFTKSRVEYNRPLLLDLRALSQHIDKVLLFSHMEQPVRDVRKLLTAKGVSYGLSRVDPVAFDTILTPWLNRAAKQLVATPAPNSWQGWRFWSTLRNRAGMAAMFGNIANAVQQLAGFSMAAVKVKPKHLMGATAQFIANPKQVSEMVSSKSAYMDGRLANEVANMSDAINEILVNPNIYEKTKNFTAKHAYFVQSAVDSVMGPIIWSGAYNQALAEGFDDRDAVRLADSAVRETQGSTSPEDISAFEEGSPFSRLFTQFAGYFNMQANLLGTEFQVLAREMGLKKGAGRGLYVLTFGFLVNAWAAEAIMQLFKGGPDDEDKDGEYLDDWLKQVFGWSLLRNTTAMVPLFGQAANALVNASNSKPYDDRMATSPAIGMLEATAKAPVSVYKAVAEGGKASRAVRDVGTLIAMTVGIPLAPITKPLGYAADVAQGNVKPTSPVDAARGVVTGTASPESKR